MQFFTTGKNKFQVYYDSWMEGGGTWFGQDYLEVIKQRYPDRKFNRCYEWCSGPGFIGFNLLDNDICKSLCLSDKFEPAIVRCDQTIKEANLTNCANAYCCEKVSKLPEYEKFDLVVANPPHYLECPGDDNYQRIAVDQNWQAHREFYQSIRQHLEPTGIILLQENQAGSLNGVKDFEQFIVGNGLKITGYFTSNRFYDTNGPTQIYYIEVKLAE